MIQLDCFSCTAKERKVVQHRLQNKSVQQIIIRAQEGDLNTILGNTVCLYSLIGEEKE